MDQMDDTTTIEAQPGADWGTGVIFQTAIQPPPVGSTISPRFTMNDWDAVKATALRPDFMTEFVLTAQIIQARSSFGDGARAFGLLGGRKELQSQQLLVADCLAAGYRFTELLLPRRSTKTTTILAWLFGRCMNEPGLLTAYGVMTAQKVARRRFMNDVVPVLERAWPDRKTRPFRLSKSNGAEQITFDNGSIIMFYGPNAESFRSDAFDVIVLDEAGELDGEAVQDVLSAALPTQDTRPGAMLVYAGTAGTSQKGNMLWDALAKATAGDRRHAAVAYWADQNTLMEELASWEPSEEHPNAHARELVERHHPGVASGLTTLDSVKDNFDTMTPERFAREYLGIFTDTSGGGGLVSLDTWRRSRVGDDDTPPPAPPERFSLAMVVHPDQTSAALVAAWRDDDGHACILVLNHRKGVEWVANRALALARQYKVEVCHDTQGPVGVEVEWLQRQTPRPRLVPYTWPMVRTAAAGIVKAIDQGQLRHWGQPTLDDAAALVVKRLSGPSNWALGRRDREDDIIDLEGAAMALNHFDTRPKRKLGAIILTS